MAMGIRKPDLRDPVAEDVLAGKLPARPAEDPCSLVGVHRPRAIVPWGASGRGPTDDLSAERRRRLASDTNRWALDRLVLTSRPAIPPRLRRVIP